MLMLPTLDGSNLLKYDAEVVSFSVDLLKIAEALKDYILFLWDISLIV